jgi:hypothetical protein
MILLLAALAACDATAVEDPGDDPDSPPVGADAPDGIYMGLRTNMDGDTYEDFFTFYPDGHVLRFNPSEGLDRPTDFDAACEFGVCGTYTVEDDEVHILWGQSTTPEVYDVDGQGALQRRGQTGKHRPTPSLDGLRLAATYGLPQGPGEPPFAHVTLTADGRFEENNLLDYLNWELDPEHPERDGTAVPRGTGTYTIRRNTLTLRYDGGFVAYLAVVVPPGEVGRPTPDAVYLNGGNLGRLP